MAVILVHAKWCGHCQTFKDKIWNKVPNSSTNTINTASIHHDMLEKTSLANAKIEGYPSLLLVGKDGKPAVYNKDGKTTNAMPQPTTAEELNRIVNTPVTNENGDPTNTNTNTNTNNNTNNVNSLSTSSNILNMNNSNSNSNSSSNNLNSANSENATANSNSNYNNVNSANNNINANNSSFSNNSNNKSYTPMSMNNKNSSASAGPPSIMEDLVNSQNNKNKKNGQTGGSLYHSMMALLENGAPALALAGAAGYMASRKRKYKGGKRGATRRH